MVGIKISKVLSESNKTKKIIINFASRDYEFFSRAFYFFIYVKGEKNSFAHWQNQK